MDSGTPTCTQASMAEHGSAEEAAESGPTPRRTATVAAVVAATSAHYRIDRETLLSRTRERRIARPRQVAMHVARLATDASTSGIGRRLGGLHHTTVIHGDRTIARLAATDPLVAAAIEAVTALVGRMDGFGAPIHATPAIPLHEPRRERRDVDDDL